MYSLISGFLIHRNQNVYENQDIHKKLTKDAHGMNIGFVPKLKQGKPITRCTFCQGTNIKKRK